MPSVEGSRRVPDPGRRLHEEGLAVLTAFMCTVALATASAPASRAREDDTTVGEACPQLSRWHLEHRSGLVGCGGDPGRGDGPPQPAAAKHRGGADQRADERRLVPPMPQNETSVAYSSRDPWRAVAAANDYVTASVVVMRTADGGQTWKRRASLRWYGATDETCSGGDPTVAYSARDRAFLPEPAVLLPDDGTTPRSRSSSPSTTARPGRPGRSAAVVANNHGGTRRSSTTRSTSPSTTIPIARTTVASM